MAYVFFRIPEDSNLWAERPRAKVFPSRELNRASGCFPGVVGWGRGVTGWWRGPSAAGRRVGTVHRGLPRGHPSPSCSQTLLFLWFLEPA